MYMRMLAAIAGICLVLSSPAPAAAAHPGEGHKADGQHHERFHPQPDWSTYPAEIQAYKAQLDQLREQQRELFEQFKLQRQQIKSAHEKLSDKKRNALKGDMKDVLSELQTTRDAIHSLRDKKLAAWQQFHQHCQSKQWDAAKIDIQTVVETKQQIIAKQRTILETQQRLVDRMKK